MDTNATPRRHQFSLRALLARSAVAPALMGGGVMLLRWAGIDAPRWAIVGSSVVIGFWLLIATLVIRGGWAVRQKKQPGLGDPG
jgi:hypothetical protein